MNDELERGMTSHELRVTLRTVSGLLVMTMACGGGGSAPRSSAGGGGASAPHAAASSTANSSAVVLDGSSYPLTADVTCEHSDDASIHDVPAAMWHATLKADGSPVSYVNLTIWQFKQGGPDQFSLGVQVGGVFHHVSTIKGATLKGSGSASVDRGAEKPTLHAKGEDEKGRAFEIALRCANVTQAVEQGGR
jgi:hypothetical protein